MRQLLLAAAVLASGCATAEPGPAASVVEAEGWAAEGGGADETRAASLADAQRRAVEEAAGVRVAATTKVDGAVATRRRIWSGAAGRIARYEILSIRSEGGFLKTRIRAAVRLIDPGELPADAKVSVAGGGAGAAAVRRVLAEKGFTVVDSGAEFTATARVAGLGVVERRVSPLSSRRARVDVELADAATGAVVWSGSREAGGLGADALSAAHAAAENAGELAAAEAAAGLSSYLWKK